MVIVCGKCDYCLWEVRLLSVGSAVIVCRKCGYCLWEVRLLSVKCVVMSVGSAVIVCGKLGSSVSLVLIKLKCFETF